MMDPGEAGSQGRKKVRARGSVPATQGQDPCVGGWDSSGGGREREARRPGTSGTFDEGAEGGSLWCLHRQGSPSTPVIIKGAPAPCRSCHTPQLFSPAVLLSMSQDVFRKKEGSSNCSKSRQRRWTRPCGSPPPSSFHTPPVTLTHKSLVDEILSKVNQHQGDDVVQQALEDQET